MADSFELLRARITIDVSNVKAASLEVAKLQASLNQLGKPIKLNIGVAGARATTTPAQQIAAATQKANQAAVQSTRQAAKEQERIRIESINRVIRLAQKVQIAARDPNIDQARRTEILRRAEQLLIQVRQRVAATSREAIRIERNLIAVRRAAQPAIDQLAAKLRSLANITDAASRAPGISSFVGNIARLGSGVLRAVASIAKLGASAIALTVGLAAIAVSGALAVTLMIKLGAAAVKAAVALGKTVLTAAVNVLASALKLVLTPIRAVYAELSRLFSIAGMRAFVTETLELAGRMEQIRQQLQLGFGGDADEEFARLRQEADLFGTSLIDLSQSFAKFALVAKQAGVDIATIRKLFTGIQAAGRVFGINADDLQGIFRALEQISSKGKLTSEELIRQLGDRLPGAFALAARALNRSSAQLVEDLRQGTVSAQEFFRAFSEQTVLEFYDKAIALSGTLNARLQRLRNLSDIIRIRFGNIFSDTLVFAVERIAQAAVRMREAFAPIGAVVSRITQSFRKAVASMNFESLINRIATVLNQMGPELEQFLNRLGRIGIVFNGAAIVGFFVAIKGALKLINSAMELFLDKLEEVTGLDLSTSERAFAAFAATLGKLPEIMAIVIRFTDKMREAFKKVFDVLADGLKRTLNPSIADQLTAPFRQSFIGILRDLSVRAAKIGVADKLKEVFAKASEDARSELAKLLAELKISQAEIQKILEGENGKSKNPAADAINGAADNLRDAMSGESAEILDPLEWVRRLNSATFKANIEKPEVEQKQAAAAEETAKNTREILGMLRRGEQVTPLFGRVPGLV